MKVSCNRASETLCFMIHDKVLKNTQYAFLSNSRLPEQRGYLQEDFGLSAFLDLANGREFQC